MAQKTIITMIDDLDGTPIESGTGETVIFAIDGAEYEIDLTDANATILRDSLRSFTEAGRPTRRGRPTSKSTVRRSATNSSAIREWASRNGHEVNRRGRISQEIQDAYRSSH